MDQILHHSVFVTLPIIVLSSAFNASTNAVMIKAKVNSISNKTPSMSFATRSGYFGDGFDLKQSNLLTSSACVFILSGEWTEPSGVI